MTISWMDIELKKAIVLVLNDFIKDKRKAIADEFAEVVIKQYKVNIKKFKANREKWINDNFEESKKILLQGMDTK